MSAVCPRSMQLRMMGVQARKQRVDEGVDEAGADLDRAREQA